MFPKVPPAKKLIYLDYAATTPLDPRVKKAMQPFFDDEFGNPSSFYRKGREASQALMAARTDIANVLSARPEEIIFTAGGTESINAAIFGVARNYPLAKTSQQKAPHLITTAIEHQAVLSSFQALSEKGYKTTLLSVDGQGLVSLKAIQKAVKRETIFLSISYANNEIGTIQPIGEIGKWLKKLNAERFRKGLPRILFHTDACQAAGVLDIHVGRLGVDLLTLNGSKFYGPKQTGILYVKKGTPLKPFIYGGGQEYNVRSGTENVAGAVGLSIALTLAQKENLKENKRQTLLRNYFLSGLFKKITDITLNGPAISKNNFLRLPSNINISISGVEGETVLFYLDSYNVAVSTGSACSSTTADPSHVILALGKSAKEALSSIRFTLGKQTKKQDLDYVLKILPSIIAELRRVQSN